jgi:hypothetical protein
MRIRLPPTTSTSKSCVEQLSICSACLMRSESYLVSYGSLGLGICAGRQSGAGLSAAHGLRS